LSWITGTLVYVLVLIATATLDELAIPAHSGPATAMLTKMQVSLTQIITALLIVVVVNLVSGLVKRVLAGVGFNRSTSVPTRQRSRPGADRFPAYCP